MKQIDEIINGKGTTISFKAFAKDYYDHKVPGSRIDFFAKAKASLEDLKTELTTSKRSKYKIKFELVDLISNNIKEIIQATPSEIPNLIYKYTTGRYVDLLYDVKGQTQFGKKMEIAFDYSAFRSSSKASWFCESLKIKSCLYCNAQFALVIGKEGKKKRLLFQLDHFYNKNRYPFLSLTIGNLIPSCSTCNIIKSKKEFSIDSHTHPYHEDANLMFEFYIDINSILDYKMQGEDIKLLIPKIKLNIPNSKYQKHIDLFRLEYIYYNHTDVIEEMLLKAHYYTPSRIEEIKNDFGKALSLDLTTINRFILGNYSLDSEINSRPLAKMMRDIGKSLGLI